MLLGIVVSDGPNSVSDISVSVNHPFHMRLLIIFMECIMQCLSGTSRIKSDITRGQRQQTHISGVFIWYYDPRSKSNIFKFILLSRCICLSVLATPACYVVSIMSVNHALQASALPIHHRQKWSIVIVNTETFCMFDFLFLSSIQFIRIPS